MKLKNYTGSDVHVYTRDGQLLETLIAYGHTPVVTSITTEIALTVLENENDRCAVPIMEKASIVTNMPLPQLDVMYVVAPQVLEALQSGRWPRQDVCTPDYDTAFRDEAGNVIGVKQFIR